MPALSTSTSERTCCQIVSSSNIKFQHDHGSAKTTKEKLPHIHHAARVCEMDLEHVAEAHLHPRYPWWMLVCVPSELIKFSTDVSKASIQTCECPQKMEKNRVKQNARFSASSFFKLWYYNHNKTQALLCGPQIGIDVNIPTLWICKYNNNFNIDDDN